MRYVCGWLLILTALLAVAAEAPRPTEVLPTADTIDQASNNNQRLERNFCANAEIIAQRFDADGLPRSDAYWLGEICNRNGKLTATEFKTRAAHASAAKSDLNPHGFAPLLFPRLDFDHFEWRFRGHELFGAVKALVFDVRPRASAGFGSFVGTVWIALPDLQIMKLDGTFSNPPQKKISHYLHFVSVRNRVIVGDSPLWVPATVWSDERDLETRAGTPQLKVRVNVFGLQKVVETDTFDQTLTPESLETHVEKEDPSSSHDSRAFYDDTERKLIAWLQAIGLLAPPGQVDRQCEKVVYKLVGDAPDFQGPIRCRIMLGSTIEWFVVGSTLVVGRSILDIPPDEPALAAVLAPAAASLLQNRPIAAVSNALLQNRDLALRKLNFQKSAKDVAEYERDSILLLERSEYKPKLQTAAVFQVTIEKYCGVLKSLYQPRFGNRISVCDPASPLRQLDPLAPRVPKGPRALVLNARLTVNSYTNEVAMVAPPQDDAPILLVPLDLVPRSLGMVAGRPPAEPFPPVPVPRPEPAAEPLKSAGLVLR